MIGVRSGISRKNGAVPPASNNNTLCLSSARFVARIVPALPAPTRIADKYKKKLLPKEMDNVSDSNYLE